MSENIELFKSIHLNLRQLMLEQVRQGQAKQFEIVKDQPGTLQIYTRHIMKNKQALYFGGVVTNKNYVSFHLMPVYVNPALLKDMSPALAKRMQGKSCFNFTHLDESFLPELGQLLKNSFEFYKEQGYI